MGSLRQCYYSQAYRNFLLFHKCLWQAPLFMLIPLKSFSLESQQSIYLHFMSQTRFVESRIPIGRKLKKVVLYQRETSPNNWILINRIFCTDECKRSSYSMLWGFLKAQIRDVGKADKTLSVVPGRRRILRKKEHPFRVSCFFWFIQPPLPNFV